MVEAGVAGASASRYQQRIPFERMRILIFEMALEIDQKAL